MQITSSSVVALLQQIPDAKGTHHHFNYAVLLSTWVKQSVLCYASIKHGTVLSFFEWLLQQESDIENHFISLNSYYGVELNAHSLISLLHSAHDKNHQFLPWLHGSQSCEKLFRAMCTV